MNTEFETNVRRAVANRPRLTPMFGSALNIPERLREYNPDLFICHNIVTGRLEIHSLGQNSIDTFCGELPFKTLDSRTLYWVWENDVRVHGKAIIERIMQSEEDFHKRKDREFRNWVEDVGKETQSLFAQDAWAMGT